MNPHFTPSPPSAHGAPASNPATLPSIRPDYSPEQRAAWLQRHEEFVSLAQAGEVDAVFLGDSLIDHWRTRGLPAWQRLLGPLRAVNFGIAGDRTQQVLWRVEHGEFHRISPRVVCLLIGTNNLDPGLGENSLTPPNSPDEIVSGILVVVEAINRLRPQTTIVLHALFPRGESHSPVREQIAIINAALRACVDGCSTIRFVDIGPHLLARKHDGACIFQPDRLHLSEAGYEAWAAALAEVFDELGLPR